jgi:hypothetical protein
MTEQVKVLKEGVNVATVVGVLVEKNLEEKSYTNNETGQTVEQIVGSISVRTGENEVHQVRLKSNKLTKAGKENSLYKGYQTINSEFVSVADAANNPELVPTQVRVSGKLTTNEYYGQDGILKQYQQIEGKFVNRLTDKDDPTPRATFEAEVFVSKTKPETDRYKDGEETGRAIVESYIPTFNAIVPYNFAVIEQGADFFTSEIQKGQTIKVYGQIVNKRVETVKLVESGFGDPIEEKSVSYTTESLISNASMPYEEDSKKAFDATLINERLVKREVYLEQQKNRGQQGAQPSNAGMNAFGGGATTAPKKIDLPFDPSKLF